MEAEHLLLEKHLKKTTIISNLFSMFVALITATVVVYAFYYDTKETLNEHTQDIKEIKTNVNEIDNQIQDFEVYRGVSKSEFHALQEKVSSMEKTMDKIDNKLDKILFQTK